MCICAFVAKNNMGNLNQLIILLTGGSGFLGKAIVNELIATDSLINLKELRIFDNNPYNGPQDPRISFIKGDTRNYKEVKEACKGVDVVIHAAAVVDWGTRPKSVVFSVNIGGTENIIKACLENNVKNLVHTSSLDAVFSGKPLVNIDESQPYPDKQMTSYCESKKLSEKLVLEANGEDLRTCVLRPSDIYGEADPYHIDSLIAQAKTGFYVRLGNGKSKCQHIYVGNMAHALIMAAKALLNGNEAIYGNVYFITDGPASNFFKFFDKILIGSGYKLFPKNLWLPKWFAYPIACMSEGIAVLARPVKKYTPKFSRFAVTYTCSDFIFNSEKAKKDFGFVPKYNKDECFDRTVKFYQKNEA